MTFIRIILMYKTTFIQVIIIYNDVHSDCCYMYNWYLLSLQSFIIHTTQVTYILYIALPLTNPNSTYLAPSSCDGNVHLSPRLLVNCPFLSPIAPACPSLPHSPSPLGFSRTQCALN